MSRYDWMAGAACATSDPNLFHTEGQGGNYSKALKVCRHCPVQRQCNNHAQNLEGDVTHPYRHGLWAGQTARSRAAQAAINKRQQRDEAILRLHARGGLNAKEIGDTVGCDERTVYRVLKKNRASYQEAA